MKGTIMYLESALIKAVKDVKALNASTGACIDEQAVLRAVVERFRAKHSIVDDVVCGRTTFAAEVEPIVQENLRVRFPYFRGPVCRTPEFAAKGEALKQRMNGVLGSRPADMIMSPLVFSWKDIRMAVVVVLLSFLIFGTLIGYAEYREGHVQSVFDGAVSFCWSCVFGGLLITTLFVRSEFKQASWRHGDARWVRKQAQYLDNTIANLYKHGKKDKRNGNKKRKTAGAADVGEA